MATKREKDAKRARNRAYQRALYRLRDRYPAEFRDLLQLELEREARNAASPHRP